MLFMQMILFPFKFSEKIFISKSSCSIASGSFNGPKIISHNNYFIETDNHLFTFVINTGILNADGTIDNEASIQRLAAVAVAYAKAGM